MELGVHENEQILVQGKFFVFSRQGFTHTQVQGSHAPLLLATLLSHYIPLPRVH